MVGLRGHGFDTRDDPHLLRLLQLFGAVSSHVADDEAASVTQRFHEGSARHPRSIGPA